MQGRTEGEENPAFKAREGDQVVTWWVKTINDPSYLLRFCYFSCHCPLSSVILLFVHMHYGTTFVVDIYFSLFTMFMDFYDDLYRSI